MADEKNPNEPTIPPTTDPTVGEGSIDNPIPPVITPAPTTTTSTAPAATEAAQTGFASGVEADLVVIEKALAQDIHTFLDELEAGVVGAPAKLKAAVQALRAKLGTTL